MLSSLVMRSAARSARARGRRFSAQASRQGHQDPSQQQPGGQGGAAASDQPGGQGGDATDRGQAGGPSVTQQAAGKAANLMEDAASDAVSQLHPALIKFLNSGYLVSQAELRQRLMEMEWTQHQRGWAQRKGVAQFEQWLAEKGDQEGIHVQWDVMQKLYVDPDDLSPLADNPRARLLAQAMIQAATLDKQLEAYRACSETAKQLANVIESGQRTGVSTLVGALRALLPWPFR